MRLTKTAAVVALLVSTLSTSVSAFDPMGKGKVPPAPPALSGANTGPAYATPGRVYCGKEQVCEPACEPCHRPCMKDRIVGFWKRGWERTCEMERCKNRWLKDRWHAAKDRWHAAKDRISAIRCNFRRSHCTETCAPTCAAPCNR